MASQINSFLGVLKSRKFWVMALAIGTVLAGAAYPGALSQDSMVGGVVMLGAFGVSLAFDPGSPSQKWAYLLSSRRFYLTIVGLLGLLLSGVFHLQLDQGALVGYVVVIGALIVGLGVDPGSGAWLGLLVDQKFWTAVVGVIVVLTQAFHAALPFGLTQEQLMSICLALGGYITAAAIGNTSTLRQAQGAESSVGLVSMPGLMMGESSAGSGDGEPWPFLGSNTGGK